MQLSFSNFTVGLNFRLELPCGTVHPLLRFGIPQNTVCMYLYACSCGPCVCECLCDCVLCVHVPLSEASVHRSPGYGLFEESISHMLTQFCTPFPSWSPPPLLLLSLSLIFLPSITVTHSPFPSGLSMVTGMLTGAVYNKVEDESWPCPMSMVNIST